MAKKESKILTFGDGINTAVPPLMIADSEHVYNRNVDTREYPSITVRPPRSTYTLALSTSAYSLGQRANIQLHAVDGNTWKYWPSGSTAWTTLTTSLTSTARAEIAEFVTGTTRYTILMNSTQRKYWDGTSTALNLGDANTPYTDKFTVHKGRIYALKGAVIYFCALNLINDWTTADDAGSITITRAKGDGTGITTYADHVIAFCEYSMHELWGTGSYSYELIDVEGNKGCISHRSIAIADRKLYWLWYNEVCEYGGGAAKKVSDQVDEYLRNINLDYKEKCVGGATGRYYYLAIPYGSSATENNLLLKYDTRLKKWNVETGSFVDFVTIGDTLYGIDNAGQVWNMRDLSATEGLDSTTPISWEFITKPFTEGYIGEPKTLSDMWLVADISTGSTSFTVGYNTNVNNNDSTSFTAITTLSGSSEVQNQRIVLPLNAISKADWYRLRFAGTGKATIHFLQKNYGVTR